MPKDNLKARYLDETYENLAVLKKDTFVVRHKQTGKIYVKKYVDKNLLPIYSRLPQINDRRFEKIFDYAADIQKGIIITEYISGMTLQEYRETKGFLSEQEACHIIGDLLQVLGKIHAVGIIHRDINPNNVMISNDGIVKLIDFNIARQKKGLQGTDTTILGTAGYAAPEQYGFSQTDERTDIYSIGVLWNTLLTGYLPSEKRYSCYPLEQIIQRCTEMDRRQRYQNVQEILDALEGYGLRRSICHTDTDDNAENINQNIRTWIPGFRTGTVWKCVVAAFGYFMMILYSIDCVKECSSTWQSLVLEIIAVLLYIWITPLIAANIGYFDRKINFLKNIPTPARVVIRILFCMIVFSIGTSLETYVLETLLGITK